MSLFYTAVPTRLGVFWLVMSRSGVRKIALPGQPMPDFKQLHESCEGGLYAATDHQSPVFRGLPHKLIQYADGEPVSLDYDTDINPFSSGFRSRVWAEVKRIPRGETRTYGQIATSIGSAAGARAVGQALKHNPVPIIIPCHRVIASSGKIGGFLGGLALKRKLLDLENAKF
jgi:methylated-DNA-[protein]-cysteine S-methyltransferase